MKSVKLIMSAFGSYAGQEVVEFDQVQHGLFLITGDTGAGKTTIFDAITYALYDQTSGGKREGNMMRSQYALSETETFVEYTFSSKGEQYVVRRNPEYYRPGKRRSSDGSEKWVKEGAKVELILPDGLSYPGKKKEIDSQIEELIGLDADQFTQIAMIAQGDFLKLLHAESRERKKIFSKIFHTKMYWRVQEELKENAKHLYSCLEDNLKDCRRETERVELAAGSEYEKVWDEAKKSAVVSFQDTAEVLADIVTEGKFVEKDSKKQVEENQKKIDVLGGKIQQGETVNSLFNALKEMQKQGEKLWDQKETIALLELEVAQGKQAKAVHKSEEKYDTAMKVMKRSEEMLKELSEWMAVHQKDVAEKKEYVEQYRNVLERKKPGLQQQIMRIQDALPKYMELEEIKNEWKAAEAKAALERLQTEAENLTACIKELDVLAQKMDTWKDMEAAFFKERDNVSNKIESYRKKATIYEERYAAFFNEQAGILASGLHPGMPCPVCGSVTHPAKASISEDAPNQAAVEQAKAERERAEGERERAGFEFQKTAQRLEVERELIQVQGERILGKAFILSNQKGDDGDGFHEVQYKQQRYEAAWEDNQRELKQAEAQYCQSVKMIQRSAQSLAEVELEQQSAAVLAQLKKTEYEKIQKELPFDNADQAKAELEKIRTELAGHQSKYDCAAVEYQKLIETMKQKEGQQESEKQNALRQQEEASVLKAEFENAILKHGFLGETDYQNKKTLIQNLEGWEEKIAGYRSAVSENTAVAAALEAQLAGKVPVELEDEKTRLDDLTKLQKSLREKQMGLFGINKKNKEALEHLKEFLKENGALQQEYEIVNNLNRTANGMLSKSVKMDFETYVQRQYFKQIIQSANKRLSRMTSNEFILQCRDMKNLGSQGQVGLDLDVYNLVSDSTRDVKTLSGGESFMASLSMALGLADIIQNTAGAIHLDTMFVDEGFGSLDDEARGQAIKVLSELADEKRLVGIISHVNELKEQIEQKLIVTKTAQGSHVRWEL